MTFDREKHDLEEQIMTAEMIAAHWQEQAEYWKERAETLEMQLTELRGIEQSSKEGERKLESVIRRLSSLAAS